ncbi:MAG: D-alanyl-D-alanine carboxypeptidase family protein [Rhizobiaceae bacterium]
MLRSKLKIAFFYLAMLAMTTTAMAANPHILVDVNSGEILSQSGANDRWYPASLTKLMTVYVTFRAIAAGELEEGSPVIISKLASRQPPSKMGYKAGTRIRVDTALKITVVKSANDVSVALAEAVAGNMKNFVARMNLEAKRLGLINTHFVNSNGLHSKKQYSSARDMVFLSAQILHEFPQNAYLFAAPTLKTAKKSYHSYNLLLERFSGANGMKTGFVCASGYNMVASAKRGGKFLLAAVMGRASQTARAVAAAKLLTEGFDGKTSSTGNLYTGSSAKGRKAKNMRPILCTPEARKKRYDPAGGKAVIKSAYLTKQAKSGSTLKIRIGGIDGRASDAYLSYKYRLAGKIPIPTKRPRYVLLNVDGEEIAKPIGIRGAIPIPVYRPG